MVNHESDEVWESPLAWIASGHKHPYVEAHEDR